MPKRETLLISDRTDLEIEVEVLRERLRRDGLPIPADTGPPRSAAQED